MLKLRDYQQNVVTEGIEKLEKHGLLYLALEMRLGKTLISMSIADELKKKHVLFITVKKAIPSIKKDYDALKPGFELTVINYESVKKATGKYDLVILDECHSIGAFPKPSQRAVNVKAVIDRTSPQVIYLSGTPSIESSSQLFHQLYMAPTHPFRKYKNFYKFFTDWGVPKTKRIAGGTEIQDYSTLKPGVVEKFLSPASISLTKKEADFEHFEPTIKTVEVEMSDEAKLIYRAIAKNQMYSNDDYVIIADSTVKEMSKLQQISGGSVICEEDKTLLVESAKANKIKELVAAKKAVVFYRYKAELTLLTKNLANTTTNVEEWQADTTNKLVLLLQTRTGSRGIDLSLADLQVYFSIEFSGEAWTQGIDRQAHMNRGKEYEVIVLLSTIDGRETIDHKVFKAVSNKQDFNAALFRQLR